MGKGNDRTLTPKLRFPEFRGSRGWSVDKLSTVAEFVNERVPIGKISLKDYISTENILPDFGGVTTASNLPPTGSATRFRADDILVSNIRPYLKKVWSSDRDGGASNDVIVIRPKSSISKAFLPFVLRNESFIDYVMTGAKGVKMPRGDIGLIKAYPVSHPSDAEQQKIADCLTSLDELIAAQGRKVELLTVHKKGLMQQLFPREGETTPRLRFAEFRNEPDWAPTSFEQLVDIQSGGTPSKANPAFWNGSIPWVSAKDMKQLFLDETEDHISNVAVDDGTRLVPAGTLLMLTRGMTLLKDVPICVLRREMTFNQDVKALRPKDGVDSLFLAFLLLGNKPRLLKMVDVAGHGTGKLNTDELKAFELASPQPPEQQRIADCLFALDTQVAAEADKLAALKTHKKGLMQQLFPSPEGG